MTSYTEQQFAWYKTSWDAAANQLTVYGKIKEGTPLSSGDTLRFRVYREGETSFDAGTALEISEIIIGTPYGGSSPIVGITPPSDSLRFEFTLASDAAVSPGVTLSVYDQGIYNTDAAQLEVN